MMESDIVEILLSWFPMLLLIAVWLFFMGKFRNGTDYQQKFMKLYEEQNRLLDSQVKALERISDILEDRAVGSKKDQS